MRIDLKTEPITELKRVEVGHKDVTVYIADDGKEFDTENKCLQYERKLKCISEGEVYVSSLTDTYSEVAERDIIRIVFNGCDAISDIKLFKFTYNIDEEISKIIDYYLMANNINTNPLDKYKDGDVLIAAYWIEDNDTDYPLFRSGIVNYETAIGRIVEFTNELKNILK